MLRAKLDNQHFPFLYINSAVQSIIDFNHGDQARNAQESRRNIFAVDMLTYHYLRYDIHAQEVTTMVALEAVKKVRESLSRQQRTTSAMHEVQFTFHAPNARKVCIAGKFNAWDTSSMPMKKHRDGKWRIKVKLSPGKYEYKYFVDGAWAQDLPCTDLVLNPFGTYNCVIAVQ